MPYRHYARRQPFCIGLGVSGHPAARRRRLDHSSFVATHSHATAGNTGGEQTLSDRLSRLEERQMEILAKLSRGNNNAP